MSEPEAVATGFLSVGAKRPKGIDARALSMYYAPMKSEYRAVVKQDGDRWIGWIEEVPGVNCQEASREELLETLRVTLAEALEFNREDARRIEGVGFEEALIAA